MDAHFPQEAAHSRHKPDTAAYRAGETQQSLVRMLAAKGLFCWAWRRVWDLNPRGLSPALAVFKTAAIGH